jgi:hypothetical protein
MCTCVHIVCEDPLCFMKSYSVRMWFTMRRHESSMEMLYVCVYVCMYACIHACMHVSMCMHVCVRARVHACIEKAWRRCIHVCLYVCVHVYREARSMMKLFIINIGEKTYIHREQSGYSCQPCGVSCSWH